MKQKSLNFDSLKIKFLAVIIIAAVALVVADVIDTRTNAGTWLVGKLSRNSSQKKTSPEIQFIITSKDTPKRVEAYEKLIKRVGPENAQQELLESGLPFDGETHLINHAVGEYIYKNYGLAGLTKCKDYFLSSCYHGFILPVVADKGFKGLTELMATCRKQGEGVAVQCAHAIGHGLLANDGYKNLPQALADCDKLGKDDRYFPTLNCHDGVFMENVYGLHDGDKSAKERWIKDDDAAYPCDDDRIDSRYLTACWMDQPFRMYAVFKGDLRKIADECGKLTDKGLQSTCFDALARQIHPLAKGSPAEINRMCAFMPEDRINACIISVAKAEFSVGGREVPFSLCSKLREDSQQVCYDEIASFISIYAKSKEEVTQLCRKIPNVAWRAKCTI